MHLSWRYFLLLWALFPGSMSAADPGVRRLGALSLSGAIDLALVHSPEVLAAQLEVKVQDGQILQARLPDNPQLNVEFENLDARGALAEENRELTASLGQTLDIGGWSRGAVAKREREWARLELEAVVRRVRSRVRAHFVAVQAGQDRIGLSQELVALAHLAHGAAVAKVAAGKAPPTDSLQSFMALSQARIDSGKAAGSLSSARRALAVACGLAEVSFDTVQGRLSLGSSVPSWDVISRQVPESPEWKRIAFGARVREAEVRAEKLSRIPPVTVEAGVRQVPEKDGRAFVAGLSLPLPAWNWNQGSIRAAQSRKLKAEAEGTALRLDLMEKLAALQGQASTSFQEAVTLRDQVLPAAQATFEGAQEAYRVGKFGSIDALNAQRSLFEARVQFLEALEAHHSALAELEELIGAQGNTVGSNSPQPTKQGVGNE
jgi:cobalt-zinc-cadmium efflux system outer membrane protein